MSMTGGEDQSGVGKDEGLVPRCFRHLLKTIVRLGGKVGVKASYLEIYNEQIMDLLGNEGSSLQCRWSAENVCLAGLLR